jgi:hypothetical protein
MPRIERMHPYLSEGAEDRRYVEECAGHVESRLWVRFWRN